MKATGNLELLHKVFGKVGKGADDTANKMGALQLIANKLPGPLKSVASGLMGIVSPTTAVVSGLIELGEAAVKYVRESVDAFAKFEMIKTNLEIVMGSAEKASEMFGELQSMAGRTPFNTDQLAEAATMLKQAGVGAKELIPTLTMLGNVAGGSAEKFNRIAYSYAQVKNNMEATSINIRQFAMAGVPIRKMLEEMGVTGTATADQINEAFRRMTEAGGQFEGAMAKGAQTLQGMRTNLEGLKENSKALQTEYSGMSDAAKGWVETQTKFYAALNEQLQRQIELKKILDKKETGTFTAEDEIRATQLRIALLTSQIEDMEKKTLSGRGSQYQGIMVESLRNQLRLYTDILSQLQPMIDAQNLINDSLARYNDEIERSEKGYRDLQAKIEEFYGKTKEGQREAIENEIKYFEAAKQRKRLVDVMGFDNATGKRIVVGKREAGIEAKELKEIDVILKMLFENLANLDKKGKELKKPYEDWVKVLAQATGYLEEDIGGKWDEKLEKYVGGWGGLKTVQEYSKEVQHIQDILLSPDGNLLTALGLDKLDVLESSADRVRAVLERMISSGKWDGSDKSVQFLINAVKKLDEAAGSSRFEEYIKSLRDEIARLDSPKLQAIEAAKKALEGAGMKSPKEAEIQAVLQAAFDRDMEELRIRRELLGLSEDDLRIRELIAKFEDEDKARAYLSREKGIDFEQYKKEIGLKIENIGLSEKELRIKELVAKFGEEQEDEIIRLEEMREKTQALVDLRERLRSIGLKVTDKGIEGLQDAAWTQNADLMKALGLDDVGILESTADRIRSELESLLNAGDLKGTEEEVQVLINLLKVLDGQVSGSKFREFIKDMREETELLGKSPEEQARRKAKKQLESIGVKNPYDAQAEIVMEEAFENEKARLELKIKSITLSEKELRIQELMAQFGNERRVNELYALEQMEEKTRLLEEAYKSLAESGKQIATNGLFEFIRDLGSAFRDGAISTDELSDAVRNMVKSLVDAMPQLLLNVGLRLMSNTATWKMGLAFIAASGLMSFVSGMIGDSENDGRYSEAEQLKRIREQISDLIEQQRKQEEYYYTKKRSINASITSVNDAIITPKGTVYTHPEDYIIATKRPDSLMSGSGGNVYINIENNAPVHVETKTETGDDGKKVIRVIIDQVKNGIANGDFDGAINAQRNRVGGRRIQN